MSLRKGWRLLLGGLFFASHAASTARAVVPEKPNFLLIVSDDQGWNDIGYHNPEVRTPRLDELARTGAELDCHYVQPQCTPTRVALLTGRYPSRFGRHCCQASNERALPPGTPTIASVLRSRGYATGMSGKWHLGSKPEWGPNHYGFDSSHGSLAGAVGMYDHRYRLNTPFAETWHRDHEPLEELGHVTDLTAAEAISWVEAYADGDRPWFFYVPFHAVHTPLVEGDPTWHARNGHIEDPERRLYAAALTHLDDAIGRIVDALDRTGQRERTLIVFTSDNGAQVDHEGGAYPPPDPALTDFSSNKPLRGRKTQVWEGGYRVPALANWPGVIRPRKIDTPMHAVDWAPTFTRLAGGEPTGDGPYDGRDVWGTINGADPTEPRTIYITWGAKKTRDALRHGDWKIARDGESDWRLHNLAEDPYETTDLAGERPDVVRSLVERFRAERNRDAPAPVTDADANDEGRRRPAESPRP